MNLITDKWIDVVREDGSYDTIAPHQIAEQENPPVDFDGGLPSIDGGYILFLIHLMQTVGPPSDDMEWQGGFTDPPTPEELSTVFQKVAYAFDVDGDGYRYMQAPPETTFRKGVFDSLSDNRKKGKNGIPMLLCGSASDNKWAQTIFGIKNLYPDPIPLKHASAMLTWAMASGKTNVFGQSGANLRKNGCVNAVVMGTNLWETVWANVLPEPDFYEYVMNQDPETSRPEEFEFPWMQQDFNSASVQYGREDFNPRTLLWYMPSWNWFEVEGDYVSDVAGVPTGKGNAKEGWRHPLSGFDPNRSDPNPMRLSKDLNVDSWVKIRFPKSNDGGAQMPEVMRRVVTSHRGVPAPIRETDSVWILATVVDGIAKATFNVNDIMPLMVCERGLNEDLKGLARRMKSYTGAALTKWNNAVTRANMALGSGVDFRDKIDLWAKVEPQFIHVLDTYRHSLENEEDPVDRVALLHDWADYIEPIIKKAFDQYCQVNKFSVTTHKSTKKSAKVYTSGINEKSWLAYNLYKLREDL